MESMGEAKEGGEKVNVEIEIDDWGSGAVGGADGWRAPCSAV